MTRLSRLSAAVCSGALLLMLGTTPVRAEEPAKSDKSESTSAPAQDPRMFDRDGKRIVGFELMSDTEIAGYRALLFSIKDPVARDQARAEHKKAMEKRAAERGVKLQE